MIVIQLRIIDRSLFRPEFVGYRENKKVPLRERQPQQNWCNITLALLFFSMISKKKVKLQNYDDERTSPKIEDLNDEYCNCNCSFCCKRKINGPYMYK